ncbi:MAG: glutamine--fructose-6-phosphate transaminase (isomerizing), partial [Planctomycetota bacterium]
GEVAIVHNGILENHEALRHEMEARGHTFLSETDSEVFAHLVEEHLKDTPDLEEAILNAARQLHGTFAFGIISSRSPGVVYALRRESPLIVGLGEDFNCFASDPLAFSSMTNRVVYLEDGELAVVERDGYRIRAIGDGGAIEREGVTLELDGRVVERGSFPDYMSKEIHENGNVARSALAIGQDEIDAVVEATRAAHTTILTGIGTSYYVAVMAQYTFARLTGRFLPALSSDELPYLANFAPGEHIIAISQSGETYDTLKALREAKRNGAVTSAILNVPTSSMAREVNHFIDQQAGPEICVLSTKSTISQLTILMRVALRLAEVEGSLAEAEIARARADLERLPELLDQVWSHSHVNLRDLARRFSVIRNWFFIGRGIYHGLALEAALKFKEVTYCHAEGMPAGALKHGTISLIDEAMHTAIFMPSIEDEVLRRQCLGAVAEINARGGAVVAFQPRGIGDREGLFEAIIEYPAECPLCAPLLALMQAQLFAYYTARALGRNVDKPRALAKSVTVG